MHLLLLHPAGCTRLISLNPWQAFSHILQHSYMIKSEHDGLEVAQRATRGWIDISMVLLAILFALVKQPSS